MNKKSRFPAALNFHASTHPRIHTSNPPLVFPGFHFFTLVMLSLFFFDASAKAQVMTLSGLDVLEKENFKPLENKRVGLITNRTAVDREGHGILEIFAGSQVKLSAVFTPEHGFDGKTEGGIHIQSSTNDANGIPFYSLYGKDKRPSADMLKGLDILVFDIQDIGTRFYTYLTTMGYAMEEAGKYGIEFMVLDRPDPIGGDTREGPVLSPEINNFTAYFKTPVRHGFTAGEMALFHKKRVNLPLKLTVIAMENYSRNMFFDETGLVWVNPSPNIRDLGAALLYPGLGCFEATNVSVGRGTDAPFHWFGAPWLKAEEITQKLNEAGLKGVIFSAKEKTPDSDLYATQKCEGVEIKIMDEKAVRPLEIFVQASYWLNKLNGKDFKIKPDDMERMTGTKDFYSMLKAGKKPEKINGIFEKSSQAFGKSLEGAGILLYR